MNDNNASFVEDNYKKLLSHIFLPNMLNRQGVI